MIETAPLLYRSIATAKIVAKAREIIILHSFCGIPAMFTIVDLNLKSIIVDLNLKSIIVAYI
jgi:hypothetical protein